MSATCQQHREDLVLYHYDELGQAARADLEAHMASCGACRAHLEDLRQLEARIPRLPSVSLDESALESIRDAATLRLLDEGFPSTPARPGLRLVRLKWAVAACIAIATFVAGRYSVGDGVAAFDSPDIPVLGARISDIEFDTESGMVQISWEESRPVTLRADLEDARVQSLLSQALEDQDNPGSRLRALRAMSQATLPQTAPDPVLVDALESVLRTEGNEGIRLQTVKALHIINGRAPLPEPLKQLLIVMLSEERSPAIRLEVLQLLVSSEQASMQWWEALQAARSDANPLIRRQAESALAGMESTQPLEQVQ
ncbi:MAG: zf-HC2 domain-containing protein [Bacteroidetes bacterium]|nr:zf-HC2 domain-containing protein [Bacteroidota bacterium]MDA0875532.1 zf-HC2 domain-containing protein [Bacteroidota bacterium]